MIENCGNLSENNSMPSHAMSWSYRKSSRTRNKGLNFVDGYRNFSPTTDRPRRQSEARANPIGIFTFLRAGAEKRGDHVIRVVGDPELCNHMHLLSCHRTSTDCDALIEVSAGIMLGISRYSIDARMSESNDRFVRERESSMGRSPRLRIYWIPLQLLRFR